MPARSKRPRSSTSTSRWRGPLREDDRDAQVAEIENAVGRGASGIVLAPLDDAAMVAPVSAAMRQKIPVVIIDSGLKGDDYVSFVATDNEVGGRLGGEKLAALLGGTRPRHPAQIRRGQRQHDEARGGVPVARCAPTRASRS